LKQQFKKLEGNTNKKSYSNLRRVYLILAHDGNIEHKHTFPEVYSFLQSNNNMKLSTSTNKEFTAVADKAIRRKDGKEYDVIRFLRGNKESARAYECCWGHYYNCHRTRFGMYAKPLDEALRNS